MYSANLANRAARHTESGHVWEEKLTNATGSIEVTEYSSVRVRAGAGTTVTIDGVLAMTMGSNEVEVFNVGSGNPSDTKATVTVAIGVAAAYVQVARYQDRQS